MHLLTGFVLTTLLGRSKRQRGKRLPSFPGVLETAHALPGRLRLRVPAIIGHPTAAEEIQNRLGRLDGIDSARVSGITGSVLLRYDADVVEPEIVFAAVVRLLGLEEQIDKTPQSHLGREIREMGDAINRAVHEQTGGLIDLWTGLPLALVVLGIRNVVSQNGQLGWPLLWWAYMSLFPQGRNQD